MAYKIFISKQAKKAFQEANQTERNRIVGKIEWLGANPNNPILDIKPLQGSTHYRLRAGK